MQELLNTIILGKWEDWLPKLPDNSIDMALLDLPYSLTAIGWDKQPVDLIALWKELKRVGKSTTAYVFTANQPFASSVVLSNPDWFKYELVWSKGTTSSPGIAKYRPLPSHETILVFGKGKTTYNPQMRTGFKPWRKLESGRRVKNEHKFGFKGYKEPVLKSGTEERYPVSVLEISQLKGNHTKDFQLHPTQKPIELFKYLVLSYSNLGQVVLDPTCGSGTTAIAAYDTGRNFICVEQDATYHARAVKRLEQARAQLRFEEMVG